MFNKSSRRLLCFFLSVIIVIGACLSAAPVLVRATLGSQSYMSFFMESKKIKKYCDKNYGERIALLAENSNIPVRVFDVVDNLEGYSETAIERFYAGYDTTIFTQDRIDTYEKLITEYLDGNNISYNKEQVHNTALKAAEIYSDSYGIKNTAAFKSFIDDVNDSYGRIVSIGLVLVTFAVLMILLLHSNKKKTIKYYTGASTAIGMSFVLIGIFSLIARIGKSAQITPQIYGNAIFNAISVMFIILILTGVVIAAASIYIFTKLSKKLKKS